MHKKINRSVRWFCCAMFLIASGCAQQTNNVVPPVSHAVPETLPASPVAANPQFPRGFAPASPASATATTRSQPAAFDTVWQRLFSLYRMPAISNPRIDREIDRYLRHPEYLITIQQRAQPYLYDILEEIEAKKVIRCSESHANSMSPSPTCANGKVPASGSETAYPGCISIAIDIMSDWSA